MDRAYVEARIAATKVTLEAWEAASLALAGGASSYTIDTGQTRTTVTRSNLTEIERTIDRLMNRIVVLEARINGSGVTHARPAW